eukprot:3462044-Lingulodinium_polyedra.AAC.1
MAQGVSVLLGLGEVDQFLVLVAAVLADGVRHARCRHAGAGMLGWLGHLRRRQAGRGRLAVRAGAAADVA